jgi:hypothetical protein
VSDPEDGIGPVVDPLILVELYEHSLREQKQERQQALRRKTDCINQIVAMYPAPVSFYGPVRDAWAATVKWVAKQVCGGIEPSDTHLRYLVDRTGAEFQRERTRVLSETARTQIDRNRWRARTMPSDSDEWTDLTDDDVERVFKSGLIEAEARSSAALQDIETQLRAIIADRNAWKVRAAGGEATPETGGTPAFEGHTPTQSTMVSGPVLIMIDGTPKVWGVPSPTLTPSARQDFEELHARHRTDEAKLAQKLTGPKAQADELLRTMSEKGWSALVGSMEELGQRMEVTRRALRHFLADPDLTVEWTWRYWVGRELARFRGTPTCIDVAPGMRTAWDRNTFSYRPGLTRPERNHAVLPHNSGYPGKERCLRTRVTEGAEG